MAFGRIDPPAVVLDHPAIEIELDEERRIVFMTRTKETLPTSESELRGFYEMIVHAMRSLERPTLGLLVDSRAAVGRNDSEFERVQAEFRTRLFGGFRRVAVVLSTFVGRLQVARYGAGLDAIEVRMFSSLEDAEAYLCGPHRSRTG